MTVPGGRDAEEGRTLMQRPKSNTNVIIGELGSIQRAAGDSVPAHTYAYAVHRASSGELSEGKAGRILGCEWSVAQG